VHDNLGNHARQEELDQAIGEAEAGPVVAVLENVEGVAVELDVAVKVHLLEGLHGNLAFSMVLGLILGLLEGEIVLDGAARVLGLLVQARRDNRGDDPEGREEGRRREERKEDGRLEPATGFPGKVKRHTAEDGEEGNVGEIDRPGRISGQRGVLDGRVLRGGVREVPLR
jgi:hypothetical protein